MFVRLFVCLLNSSYVCWCPHLMQTHTHTYICIFQSVSFWLTIFRLLPAAMIWLFSVCLFVVAAAASCSQCVAYDLLIVSCYHLLCRCVIFSAFNTKLNAIYCFWHNKKCVSGKCMVLKHNHRNLTSYNSH